MANHQIRKQPRGAENKNAGQNRSAACGIPGECPREIPGWLVAVDNVPTLVLFVLGFLIMGRWSALLALAFLVYCSSAIVLFWALICTSCHHYDSGACPCGYGRMAPKLFKARRDADFRKVFKRNIAIMFPCWLAPTLVGIYLLRYHYTGALLALFLGFCLVGYILIPAIAKLVGCKGCAIKDRCPWMS
ncbi:MAG: hypothetical protein M1457_06840 [bacterium]|nr:hypothetical protein [bacterium]